MFRHIGVPSRSVNRSPYIRRKFRAQGPQVMVDMTGDVQNKERTVILTTISSNSAFHRDVRAALDGLPFEAVWDLSYDQAARLHGLKSDQKCLGIIDFSDQASALAFS